MLNKRKSAALLDPVAMGIKNIISSGSTYSGDTTLEGGLLLQGEFHGNLRILRGTLVVEAGAKITGKVEVQDTVFVLGQIGDSGKPETVMIAHGELHLASTSIVYGTVSAKSLVTYNGTKIHGTIHTIDEGVSSA